MPRPKKSVADSDQLQLDAFAKQVEAAILHYADAQWLGHSSPLAQPWVLGTLLNNRGESETERGNLLRELILEAVQDLVDEEQRRVIVAGYIKRNPHLTNAGVALREGMNERQFFRKRAAAVRCIGEWLYKRLLSPLRLETPPRLPFAGRHQERRLMQTTLQAGKSVYVAGPSGIGKSTLAAEVVHELATAVFWYTVRPGLNDNLESLIFALAWFMRQQGAHNLWLQIVADSQDLDSERIVGLLRYDLSTLAAGSYVLCFDEVDLLNADDAEHARLLHTLEIVRAQSPLLLIGQRAVLEADALVTVGALPEEELAEWHGTIGSTIEVSLGQLMRQTQGIPVLLSAWQMLARSDPRYITLVDDGKPITLESAFQRVWRRVSEDERLLIGELAVHGGTAPVEILTFGAVDAAAVRTTLLRLRERSLVTEPSAGSVRLPVYLVHLVEQHLDRQTLAMLHLRVAHALQAWGQHMDAVQHWIAGGRADAAVWLWFRYREQEVSRGNATRAVGLLAAIDPATLPEDNDRTALQMALAELHLHLGHTDEAQAATASEPKALSRSAQAHMDRLRGDVADTLGNLDQALAHYRASLDALIGEMDDRESMVRGLMIRLHQNRMANPGEARRQALLFQLHAERRLAVAESMLGNFDAARTHYQNGMAIAAALPDAATDRARFEMALGMMLMTEGKLPEAIEVMESSLQHLEEIGHTYNVLVGASNLAYAYLKNGNPQRALEVSTRELPRARRMRNAHLIGGLAVAAAEAALTLGQVDEAESLAIEGVQQEEEWHQHWALSVYALVRAQRGAHTDAHTLAQQGLESAQETENPYSIGYCQRILGEVRQKAAAHAEARAWFLQARGTYASVGLANEVAEVDALIETLG